MIIDIDHVRAVEVRRAVAVANIQRVVAVVEEPQGALLVKGA